MHQFRWSQKRALILGIVGGTTIWLGSVTAEAQQADDVGTSGTPAAAVRRLLRDFVRAVEQNDIAAAQECFASEEDWKTILPAENAATAAKELAEQVRTTFPPFVRVLKAFGDHDIVDTNPGTRRRTRRGDGEVIGDADVAVDSYISLARDSNYFIELRFRLGAILRTQSNRWVVIHPVTKLERSTQEDGPYKLLRAFAAAVDKNDVDAAVKLFANEEDMHLFLTGVAARKSALELRSHVRLLFHEFVDALKDFGEHELKEVVPGAIRRLRRGEWGATQEVIVAENGHITFTSKDNDGIRLRFNIGGILAVDKDRWVITNMVTRRDRFSKIEVEEQGE
ncbi:MAG: hypothetical protein KKB50_09370 [Planctomycetes bacterium]|nr:hypothetical protein [Planctomycetota bacterium]